MESIFGITTFYAAPRGEAARYGGDTYDEVFRAFTDIASLRDGGAKQPITLRLHAGVYETAAWNLGPRTNHLTVEPYGDGPVVLSAGRRISGFRPDTYNGVSCFSVHLPEVENGPFRFTDFYVDGLRADLTRYPEEGYLQMNETEYGDPTNRNVSSKWFTVQPEEKPVLDRMYAPEDWIVSFSHLWTDEHSPVETYDRENGRITMSYYSRREIHPGSEYILENVRETFGKPNQWYLDRRAGMLYYIPRDRSQTPESIEAYAPAVSEFLNFAGTPDEPVDDIRFRDLTVAYSRGDYGSCADVLGVPGKTCAADSQAVSNAHGLVNLRYSTNIAFENCTFRNYGLHGMFIGDGCHGIRVEGCTFYDGGAGGIRVCGGDLGKPEHTRTDRNTVSDCVIRRCGRRYRSACGILLMHTASNDVIHNEISDLYYTGISCGWTWGYTGTVCHDNRILWNHIHQIGQGLLSDMGGIYLLGSQPGTRVAYNHIHDIRCKEYGGWALYTDEGSSGILLESNLCYDTSSNSYHQHYGAANVVRNNIFAFSKEEVLRLSVPEFHLCIAFTGNILYADGTPLYADSYRARPDGLKVRQDFMTTGNNLVWSRNGAPAYSSSEELPTLEAAQAHGMEEGSLAADPCFTDPEHRDFTLRPESPAFALGFIPFDYRLAGVRK